MPSSPRRPGLLIPALVLLLAAPAAAEEEPAAEGAEAPADAPPEPGGEAPAGDAAPAAEPPPPAPIATAEEPPPPPSPDLAEVVRAAAASPDVVRVSTSGRVGGGLIVENGAAVVTLLPLVEVGQKVRILTRNGEAALGRVHAADRTTDLALVLLVEPIDRPAGTAPLAESPPAAGEAVVLVGHGGSIGLRDYDEAWRALLTFSPVTARVSTHAPGVDDQPPVGFLVDRSPGEGDLGAVVFDRHGRVAGLLLESVPGGGERSLVVSADRIRDLLALPRSERPLRKASHLQFWSGAGFAGRNSPSHLAGSYVLGVRIAVLDHLRIEPWFEALLGFRTAIAEPEPRPEELWWALETGLNLGYRIPIHAEGSRDYVVPAAGFRLSWHRFQHTERFVAVDCPGGTPCESVVEERLDRLSSFRPAIDLGFDIRHGRLRIGYRYALDPTDVQGGSLHRILVTVDGFPLPIRVGPAD